MTEISGLSNESPTSAQPSDKTAWTWKPLAIAILILLAGAALRARQFEHNRSLWRDEASLSYNIVTKSTGELLFKNLEYNQAAPVGFLAIEKLAVAIFGNGEMALRAFPFVCGLISLVLFYFICRRMLGRRATMIALTLFAISQYPIYYSAEVKQFGCDAMWSLAILLCGLRYLQNKGPKRDLIVLGIAGFVAIWFSHPAIFTLAGVGMWLFFDALWRGRGSKKGLVIVGAVWLVTFAIDWFVFLKPISDLPYMQHYWHERSDVKAFFPIPKSLDGIGRAFDWTTKTFFDSFVEPAGLPAAGLASVLMIVGIVALFRHRRAALAMLLFPMLVTIAANVVQKYPFQNRMVLFLVPSVLMLIAIGLSAIWTAGRKRGVPIGIVILVILLIQPVATAARNFRYPPAREEFRAVLEKVMPKLKSGDTVYLYEGSIRAWKYYTNAFDKFKVPEGVTVIEGLDEDQSWDAYRAELATLQGKPRVWILFTHVNIWKGADQEQLFLHFLDEMGTKIDEVTAPVGADGFLYDLSRETPASSPSSRPSTMPLF